MNYTRFRTLQQISGVKILRKPFCTRVKVTQGHWLEGPKAHSQASLASSARAALAMAATARDQGR
jgi:hypothetical protein